MATDVEPVRFGSKAMSPEEVQAHQRKVEEAQARAGRNPTNALKGNEPVGGSVRRPSIPNLVREPSGDDDSGLPQQQGGPVNPRPPGSKVLRPETEKMLRDAINEQATKITAPPEEEPVKEELVDEGFSSIDLPGLKNDIERIFDNPKRRKEIESRCSEMRFEDLLVNDEVKQIVPIIPDKFVAKYRSLTPAESLFIKRIISTETVKSDSYLLERYGLCQLACSLISINGSDLPSHLDKNGDPDEKLFAAKLKVVTKKSIYIVTDLYVNYGWFDSRVRQLINPAFLGNG